MILRELEENTKLLALWSIYLNGRVKKKAKLTTWLVEQRMSGDNAPFLSPSSDFEFEIIDRNFLSTSQRIHRFFLYCCKFKNRIGDTFIYENQHRYKESFNPRYDVHNDVDDPSNMAIMAYTECVRDYDLDKFADYLLSSNLINNYSFEETDSYILSPLGIEKLDSISTNTNSKKAFVAMWFDSTVNQIYEEAIEPAIREAGFEPIRIDRKEHNNKIDDEIIAELRRSRFVIADFTSAIHEREGRPEAIARGGVYYEAGFAHGMGIPVIWTCRSDMIGLVHFDTRQYNHIDWKDAADLKKRLYDRIRATIT